MLLQKVTMYANSKMISLYKAEKIEFIKKNSA